MWSTEWAALWPAFLAATHDYVGFAFPPPSDNDGASTLSSAGAVADSVRTNAVHLMGVAILTFTSAKLGTQCLLLSLRLPTRWPSLLFELVVFQRTPHIFHFLLDTTFAFTLSSAAPGGGSLPPTPATFASLDVLPIGGHPALDAVQLGAIGATLLDRFVEQLRGLSSTAAERRRQRQSDGASSAMDAGDADEGDDVGDADEDDELGTASSSFSSASSAASSSASSSSSSSTSASAHHISRWSCTNMCTALRTADVLLTHRGDAVTARLAPVLLRLRERAPASLPRAHLKRFQHALKTSLLNLLKWRPAGTLMMATATAIVPDEDSAAKEPSSPSVSFADAAFDALAHMGYQDEASMARRWLKQHTVAVVAYSSASASASSSSSTAAVASSAASNVDATEMGQHMRNIEPPLAGLLPVAAARAADPQLKHLLAKLQTFGAAFNAHLVATCLDERHAPSLAHAHALPSSMYPPVNLALLPPLPLHVPPHHPQLTAAATQVCVSL